jgi:hypothetical protein
MKKWIEILGTFGAMGIVAGLVYIAATSPLVVRSFQAVIVTAAVTLGLAMVGALVLGLFFVFFRVKRWAIATATEANESVQYYGLDGQVYATNALGLPLQALHLHTNPYILPGGDGEADQFNTLKWAAFNTRRQKVINGLVEPPAQLEPGLLPVLPVILPSQRILVAGGQGSGKTNLLQWMAYEKQRLSKVLVIDTHAAPGQWPIDPAGVLGRGRNWAGVEQALIRLLDVMNERYKDIDAGRVGIRGHEIITVLADEWTMIPEAIGEKIIKQYTKPVLSESRKAGIDFILAAHDTTVEALGIKGMGGLIKAFDWIVETDQQNGQYICRVWKPTQKRSEATIYAAPPLFGDRGAGQSHPTQASNPAVDVLEPELTFEVGPEPDDDGELTDDGPTDEEFRIMVAYNQVRNENGGNKPPLKQVCEKLGWNPGGMQYAKVKAAMAKWTDEDL